MTKSFVDFAIIIPTLNEERYIGRLLDSIASQTYLPKEIVVVDATSEDKTISEIKKRQLTIKNLHVFQIPKYTISKQRNFGVKKTTAKHLLFLDADMILKDIETLKKYWDEIEQKNPDIAVATNLPDRKYWKDNIFYFGMDALFKAAKPLWPMALGMNMYVKRETFEKIGGFDAEIRVGEDFELVQRIVKNGGKFILLKKPKLYTSTRRQEMEGRRKIVLKSIKSFFIVNKYGYKHSKIPYEFGKFNK